jgi:hypothetical protein
MAFVVTSAFMGAGIALVSGPSGVLAVIGPASMTAALGAAVLFVLRRF